MCASLAQPGELKTLLHQSPLMVYSLKQNVEAIKLHLIGQSTPSPPAAFKKSLNHAGPAPACPLAVGHTLLARAARHAARH